MEGCDKSAFKPCTVCASSIASRWELLVSLLNIILILNQWSQSQWTALGDGTPGNRDLAESNYEKNR